MPLLAETLDAVKTQTFPYELIALDNESTDGSVDELKKHTENIINIPAGTYIPGKVLNLAMEASHGELVVFLNSDCAPQHETWLENLLKGFNSDKVAAVFGRQIPRPDCDTLMVKDTEATFGDGSRQKFWRHCFSMASSAIRRSVWEQMRFNEDIQYSEDIDWSWRARQKGYEIKYVPDSIVMHSHNYSLRRYYRRQYGEGRAEAEIFGWSDWQRSLLRYSILPFGRSVLSDWKYCLKRGAFGSMIYSPFWRLSQLLGRKKGFNTGWREKSLKK